MINVSLPYLKSLPTFHKTSTSGMTTPHNLAPAHLSELLFYSFLIHSVYSKKSCAIVYLLILLRSRAHHAASATHSFGPSKNPTSTTVPFLIPLEEDPAFVFSEDLAYYIA